MKHLQLITIICLLIFSCSNEAVDQPDEHLTCDNGTFVGRVTLKTQQQVNDFGELCYTKIDGTLVILDLYITEDNIVDLSPLSNLTEIYTETYPDSLYGSLHIYTKSLTNLDGLNNLEKVGRLVIQDNLSLVSLSGLESLTTIGTENVVGLQNELRIQNNIALQSLDGLNSLTKIGLGTNLTPVRILGNPVLENIDGLESLTSINSSVVLSGLGLSGNLWINGNHQLTNVNGLSRLTNMHGGNVSFLYVSDLIGGDGCPLSISGNSSLTDFCGLQNLVTNGDFGFLTTNTFCSDYFGPSIQDIIDGNCSQ